MRFFIFALLLGMQPGLHAGILEGKVVIDGRIQKLENTSNPYGGDDYSMSMSKNMDMMPHHLLLYLEGVPGVYKPSSKRPVLGQKNRQFTQDIIPVIAGGGLEITNEDAVYHHIRSSTRPWVFNLEKRAPGESATVTFAAKKNVKNRVVPIYCDIHSSMRAEVVVLDNPFYVLMNETGGHFQIKGVPPGTYTLNAYHPTLKFTPMKVTVSKGKRSKSVTVTMIGEN